MITAKEAKHISDNSSQRVLDYLKNTVEPAVIQASEAGHSHTFMHLGSADVYSDLAREIKPSTKGVVQALIALGYRADIIRHGESYVPRGSSDKTSHQSYGLQIEW